MRKMVLGFALAALTLPLAAAADAQPGYRDRNENGVPDRVDRRRANADWRAYRNYDWNRPDRRYGNYDPSRYYRDGRYYQVRTLGRGDRIYRGGNGQYYCRRSDGTTGLILGGVLGGLAGNALDGGRSSTLGTLLGAAGGAALGRSVDRGQVRCR